MQSEYSPVFSARFWAKVDRNGPVPPHRPELGPCWLWTGWRNPKGYGGCSVHRVNRLAHRVAWELANGPIPTGHQVQHACDTPPCVRDSHLTTGLPSQNSADMVAKGRSPKNLNAPRGEAHPARLHPERLARGDRHPARLHPERLARGERHGNALLTWERVAEIRRLYAAGEANQYQLADRFEIHQSTVWGIIHNRAWRVDTP